MDNLTGLSCRKVAARVKWHQPRIVLYKVDATLTAAHLMSQIPGLRHRVEETLTGIIETAEEIRRLHGHDLSMMTNEQPMRLHFGEYIISYLLDLDRRAAKVVFVEMVTQEQADSDTSNRSNPVPRTSQVRPGRASASFVACRLSSSSMRRTREVMAGERVLVVDDHEDSRELYGQYLRLCGYDVETAADGDAALRCALRRECDIVVLDLALPKFDGLTVLRMLRSNARTKAIPVIILSASAGGTVRAQALEAGADRFLTKPCLPEELEGVLRELLAARSTV